MTGNSRLAQARPQVLPMQSSMKNQRSSPASPFDFTSLRQTASLPLFALHLAFISFSLSAVNFIFEGFAAGVGVVAGAAVWADAVWSEPTTSSMAARQTLVRSIGFPPA